MLETFLDIDMGALYFLFLLQTVIWEWEFFNRNGPQYMLTLYYYIKFSKFPFGIIGFMAIQHDSCDIPKLALRPQCGTFSTRTTHHALSYEPHTGIIRGLDPDI